ncbi:MAG: hypothetical protein ABFC34_02870 [Methanobacterium sp.]
MDKYNNRDIERIINVYLDGLSKYIDIIVPVLDNTFQVMEQTTGTIGNFIEYELIGDPSLEKNWETIALLYNAGFWYIPSLPYSVFKNLLKLDDKSKDNVSSLIMELMNNDNCYQLESIVNKWNLDIFKEKELIFQEALQSHKEGKYVLSIPALTLQAEPIIKDYLSLDHGKMMKNVKNKLKKSMENTKEEKKKEIYIDENKSRKMYLYLVSLDFISQIVFKFYARQDFNNVKNPFNRNVICHGALQIKDFNQELSTKLFLFLDTLHFSLSHSQYES